MNRRWTTKRVWRVLRFVLIGLGVGGLLAATTDWNWRNQLNRSAADLLVRSLAPQIPVPHIAIVGIDDASLNSTSGYGRLTEWDRTLYARLLAELERAGARVVVFDVLFTGRASAGDAAFAQALRDHPNTVLAVAQADDDQTLAQPIDQLQVGNPLAHVTITPDSDGVLRRVPLLLSVADQQYETLGLAAARLWWNLPANSPLVVANDRATIANWLDLPVQADGALLVDYAGAGKTYPLYSFVSVVNGGLQPNELHDTIVLVGATGTALGDRHATPTTAVMDGVEFHANVLGSLLNRSALVEQSLGSRQAITMLVTLCLTALAGLRRPNVLLAVILGGAVLTPVVGAIALQNGLRLDVPSPLLAFGVVGLTLLALQNAGLRRDHAQVLGLFEQRTPPSVLRELLHSAERGTLHLGGERREVTVVFMDMRGFTALSERLPPEDMMNIINTYLTIIANALIEHGGTLNQYAGDQAMAIFNAPIAQTDHAARAVRAAYEALAAIERFNQSPQAQQLPARASFGAGVNTGVGVVGNVGAMERYDYSVIGDVTNVAARLCGAAPANSVYIGPDTLAENLGTLREQLASVGDLTFKGKEQPLAVSALILPGSGAMA